MSRFLCTLALVGLMVSPALAAEKKVSKKSAGKKACPVSKAMGNLPKMTFKVGDKSMHCPVSAAAFAKKSSKSVQYVVSGKSFKTEGAAKKALVTETEKFVKAFTTPSECKKTGILTIAGAKCDCPSAAAGYAKVAKKAMSKVKMTYKVGKKGTHCPKTAASLAKKLGVKQFYVVSGKETACSTSARLNLARAKYAAAVKAVVAERAKEAKSAKKAS